MSRVIVAFLTFGFLPALSGEAATRPRPPGAERYENRVSLPCYINSNGHQFYVGNAHATAISKGTRISFSGKIDNGAITSGTVPVPTAIPPHIFVILMYNPRFDPGIPCRAWINLPPVAAPTP